MAASSLRRCFAPQQKDAIFILKTLCFLFEAPFSTSKLLLLCCQTLHLNCLRALLSLQSELMWKLLKNLFLIHTNMRPEVHMEKNLYLGSSAHCFLFLNNVLDHFKILNKILCR